MSIDQNNITDIAVSILNNTNSDYKWLYVKLPNILRIEHIDKNNDYYVKPNDCRWWFGDNKTQRYKKLCKIIKKNGHRTFSKKLLEEIVKIRLTFDLFIPNHPTPGFSFEKDIFSGGRYFLCKNGIVVKKKCDIQEKTIDECPICYSDLSNNNFIITKCNHKFCVDCIFKHFQNDNGNKCPLCRKEFAEKKRIKRRNIVVDSDDEYSFNDNPTFITQVDESDDNFLNNSDNVNRNLVFEFNNTLNDSNDISLNYFNMYNYNNRYIIDTNNTVNVPITNSIIDTNNAVNVPITNSIIDTNNAVNDWYLDNALNTATFEPTLHTTTVLSDWLTNFNT